MTLPGPPLKAVTVMTQGFVAVDVDVDADAGDGAATRSASATARAVRAPVRRRNFCNFHQSFSEGSRWVERPYVDDEFIADVAMNFGGIEQVGMDRDIAEWLREQSEPAAVEAGAAFLQGYWKSARAVDAESVRIVLDEMKRRASPCPGWRCRPPAA